MIFYRNHFTVQFKREHMGALIGSVSVWVVVPLITQTQANNNWTCLTIGDHFERQDFTAYRLLAATRCAEVSKQEKLY